MKNHLFIPYPFFYCAKCREELFYSTEEMIVNFLKISFDDTFYDEEWDDYDDVVDCEKKMTFEEWSERNEDYHKYLFERAFGKSQIATNNWIVCPHCGHENRYESFYINKDFIMNQR